MWEKSRRVGVYIYAAYASLSVCISAKGSTCALDAECSYVQLRSPPMTAFRVILDLGIRLQTEPLRDGSILTTGLGEDTFYAEGFLGWHSLSSGWSWFVYR